MVNSIFFKNMRWQLANYDKGMPRYTVRIIGLIFIWATVGCSLIPSGGIDTCIEPGLLFVDNFNVDQNCGWYLYEDDSLSGSVTQANGYLEVESSTPGEFWWSNPQLNEDDVVIQVQTQQISGPDDNAYGVMCRYQNENNYYVFLISGDGYYAIGKFQSGASEIRYISGQGEYQFSEQIRQGPAINEIQVECVGNTLSLIVNGVTLDSVVDDSFPSGNIGLGVTTFQAGTSVVRFDDVQVFRP